MTRIPAYERDPYRTELEVRVEKVGEDEGSAWVALDDTILYPEGGGQPADRGRLDGGEAGVEVVDVQEVDGAIRHHLAEGGARPRPGERMRLELDWERRFDHMQQHTAQHLLTAVAADRFGWQTTSFHLGSDRCDIELDAGSLSAADRERLEEAVAAEVREARPVRGRRVSPGDFEAMQVRTRGLPESHAGDVRLVEIEGVDLNTCGGTHLSSTAEIESVKLLDTESIRGGTRLYWVAGRRVRRLLGIHEARNAELRRVLETADEELVEMARLKLDRLDEAERRARRLEGELAGATARRLASDGSGVIEAHFDDTGGGFLNRVAQGLLELAPARPALLTASESSTDLFVLVLGPDVGVGVEELGPEAARLLEGRGGGSGGLYQGKAGSLRRRDEVVEVLASRVIEPR